MDRQRSTGGSGDGTGTGGSAVRAWWRAARTKAEEVTIWFTKLISRVEIIGVDTKGFQVAECFHVDGNDAVAHHCEHQQLRCSRKIPCKKQKATTNQQHACQ